MAALLFAAKTRTEFRKSMNNNRKIQTKGRRIQYRTLYKFHRKEGKAQRKNYFHPNQPLHFSHFAVKYFEYF